MITRFLILITGMLTHIISASPASRRVTSDFRCVGRAMKVMRGKHVDSDQSGISCASLRGGGATVSRAPPPKSVPAILFDIDGVFKHGGAWEPKGLAALRRVQTAGIPYAFMTNGGGGRTEAEYATEMAAKLVEAHHLASSARRRLQARGGGDYESGVSEDEKGGGEDSGEDSDEGEDDDGDDGRTGGGGGSGQTFTIDPERMVLSYSPWRRDLVPLLGGEAVLVVGDPADKVLAAAKHLGFSKAVHLSEYGEAHPLLNPFKHENEQVQGAESEDWGENFKAVLVFTDPLNVFEALQIVSDVLLSSKPGLVEVESGREIPLYFSNPDVLWKTQFPHPRFGQGAFRLALEAVFVARLNSLGFSQGQVQRRLSQWHQYGKPEVAQFDYALETALLPQLRGSESSAGEEEGVVEISDVYLIGDNPKSDMQGPINMNNAAATAVLGKERKGATPLSSLSAATASIRWSGALVRTGVYREGIDDTNGATVVCDDVAAAVEAVLARHGLE
mmetsp:Transcript_59084/g.115918  ORF Transcript_59084/g.115918 Transcript_59084/m.115918 type:complete len:504 (+) Transcript_59084:92-1603(+)